jgi:hypothetical protein
MVQAQDGIQADAVSKPKGADMFAHHRPRKLLSYFDILTIILTSGLLFAAALSNVDHLLWSIPAMTLFSLTGITVVCAFLRKPARSLRLKTT